MYFVLPKSWNTYVNFADVYIREILIINVPGKGLLVSFCFPSKYKVVSFVIRGHGAQTTPYIRMPEVSHREGEQCVNSRTA